MTFSIIIPVYNIENYLRECVDSVINQTCQDFELILIDNGSTDSSGTICDEYASKYSNVLVKHVMPNIMAAGARNDGLKLAVGEYVYFMDSDDYLIDNHVLEKINNRLTQSPDVVHFKSVKWFEATGKLSKKSCDMSVSSDKLRPYEKYLELIDKDSYTNTTWSKVIKRTVLVNNHIEFEKGLLAEDNDWYYKVVTHLSSLELIDEPLYVYRQRSYSTSKIILIIILNICFGLLKNGQIL